MNAYPTEKEATVSAMLITGRRELDHRSSNGIDVTLSWCPARELLYVTVLDDAGDSFELVVEPHEALEVFHHPYAFAAHRGVVLLDVAA
jgi:hypothetical protein